MEGEMRYGRGDEVLNVNRSIGMRGYYVQCSLMNLWNSLDLLQRGPISAFYLCC